MQQLVRYESDDFFQYLNLLIYGPFGAGKTILAATAEQCEITKSVILADAEGGRKSISEFGIKGIEGFRINTFKGFNKLYEFCRSHTQLRDGYQAEVNKQSTAAKDFLGKMIKLEAWLREAPEDTTKLPKLFYTVLIDSLTEVQKYAMYHILGIDINTIKLTDEIAIPQIQHWGKNAEMIRLLVRSFRDLDMHTIFTTLDQADRDEFDGSISITPSLPGKLAKEVCAFLDIVGYLHVTIDPQTKQPKRVLQVQPAGKINAKSRFPSLGVAVENPTIGKIVEKIKTAKGAEI